MHEEIVYNPLQKLSAEFIEEDCNVVVLAPTSAGKTIVAEQFLFKAIADGKKGVYLSPLKALTEEKRAAWQGKYEMTVVTGDHKRPSTFSTPLILMTTEALDSKSRSRPQWMGSVGCVAVDEAHLLSSEGRGDAVEIGLMRFAEINSAARLICLSATIPNAKDFAKWLTKLNGKRTEVVETSWRPVRQKHFLIKSGRKPWNVEADTVKAFRNCRAKFPDLQILVFVHAIGRGNKLSQELGIPFHYSKVPMEKRRAMEEAFAKKRITAMISTSTLAYGINLPADVCIISGAKRGPMLVEPGDMKQMAGRSGRYGLSECGYVYYVFEGGIADDTFKLCLETPDVVSVLPQKLYFHIVSFIYREGMDEAGIKKFMGKAFSQEIDVDGSIEMLERVGAIERAGGILRVTKFGKAAALMYIDPIDFIALHKNLRGLPKKSDSIAFAFADIPSNEVPTFVPSDIEDYAERRGLIMSSGKATIVAASLDLWIRGLPLRGSFAMTTPMLISDLKRWIAGLNVAGFNKDYTSALELMVVNGIPEHLSELVKFAGIGRVRALELYNAGIQNDDDIRSKKGIVRGIIGQNLTEKILNDINHTGIIKAIF